MNIHPKLMSPRNVKMDPRWVTDLSRFPVTSWRASSGSGKLDRTFAPHAAGSAAREN